MSTSMLVQQPSISSRGSLVAYLYLAPACVLNLYISAVILRAYSNPRYSTFHPELYVLLWALGVSVASSLLISFYRLRLHWISRFWTVALLDIATSLLWLFLPRCLRILVSGQRLPAFGYALAVFLFAKLTVLTWYGWSNVRREQETSNRWYVFIVALVIYFGMTPWLKVACWPAGDEPHYLLLTHSLVYDHDLDVANNYARQDYLPYYPVPLGEHTVRTRSGGAMLWHDVGISILLVPGYWADGRLGAMLETNLFAASIALAVYILAGVLAASPAASLLTAMLFGFSVPMSVFASQIFPEVIGAALCLWSIVAFTYYLRRQTALPLLIAGTFIGMLPWICIRYWMLAGPFFVIIAARVIYARRSSPATCIRELLWLGLPPLCFALAFSAFDLHFYGTPLPNAGYLAISSSYPQFMPYPLLGAFGMIMDRAAGLLPVTPLYIVVVAGMLKMRQHRWLLAIMLLPTLAYFGFMSFAVYWAGGWCPQGRYVLSAVLPCVPAAALVLQNARRRLLLVLLSLWSAASAIIFTALPLLRYPSVPDNSIGGLNQYIAAHVGISVGSVFPSMMHSHDWALVCFWCGVIAVCMWLLGRISPEGQQGAHTHD